MDVCLRPEQGTARLDLEDGEELRRPREPPTTLTQRRGEEVAVASDLGLPNMDLTGWVQRPGLPSCPAYRVTIPALTTFRVYST